MKKLNSPELLEKSKQKVHFRTSKSGKKFTAGSYIKHKEILEDLRRAVDYLSHLKKSPTTRPKNEHQEKEYKDYIEGAEDRIKTLRGMLKKVER